MSDKLVTIISGAYNVAQYLEKGLGCILNQSYRNLEIILINDGSTDHTADLCDQLQASDARIRVIHQHNQGIAAVKHLGLSQAKGEYVWFYDVDDECSTQLIEKCVNWMEELAVDLVIFGFTVKVNSTNLSESIRYREQLIESNEILKSAYHELFIDARHGNGFNWNKFYRKSFLDAQHCQFLSGINLQEDETFNIQLYPHLERCYISSDCLYEYIFYRNGNSGGRYIPTRFHITKTVHAKQIEFAKKWGIYNQLFINATEERFLRGIFAIIINNVFHSDNKSSLRIKLQSIKAILADENVVHCIQQNRIMPKSRHEQFASSLFAHRHILLIYLYSITIRKIRAMKTR